MNNSPFSDTGANKGGSLALRAKHGWHRVAVTFANDDDHLPFAVLIASITAVATVLFLISWLHIAAKIPTIGFRDLAFTTDNPALHFLCHRFA